MNGANFMKRDKEWHEALEAMHEISKILNTGLDRETLAILVNLCEAGVNPEALALVVQELRGEAARKRQQLGQGNGRSWSRPQNQ
ncbi:hypothetical protein NSK_007712 [Nannochloropsis salina CCMP1776]|uniref:Mitotic-spindle organizing protein 1 n=1 Tax=Nannochloropsis salina CCMP1776 TaxID=1027361 RepID=A0A4D9CWS9_9STRA|nr:hypothetical protein NSK_007712 [Nannochloropsis salina CCMP1776]|eukprot:TFJ81069.1 hypothetical protein NSK_007712 [Nannochloropsis salina CCMP1776]